MPIDVWKDFGVRLIACFAILWSPFFYFSSYRGHPIPATSLVYAALLFLLIASLAAWLAGRGRGVRRVAVFSLLIVCFLDLQVAHFDGAIAFIGAIAVAAAAWLIRENLAVITAVMFSTVLISSLVMRPGEDYSEVLTSTREIPAGEEPTARGRLIHLVLDEFVSPSSIPIDIEGGAALRADLEAFFRNHGFALVPNAIGEYAASRASMSGILNFEAGANPQARVLGKRPFVLVRNAYFERLQALGYSIEVYQSTYMDFCRESPVPLASCLTFRYDGTAWLEASSLTARQKLSVMMGLFLNLPGFFESVWKAYTAVRLTALRFGVSLPQLMAWDGSLAPVTTVSVFDRLREGVEASPDGTAIFAHLLFPHGPYVYDSACNMRPHPLEWLGHHPLHQKDNTPEGRETRYRQYFEQVRCVMKTLDTFFEDLKRQERWADTEFVLHSDHGSRIWDTAPRAGNRESLTDRDLADAFGALLAIRSPRFEQPIHSAPRPISRWLAEFAGVEAGDDANAEDSIPYVFLEEDDDEPWIPIPYSVESFGAVGADGARSESK